MSKVSKGEQSNLEMSKVLKSDLIKLEKELTSTVTALIKASFNIIHENVDYTLDDFFRNKYSKERSV